MSCLTKEGADMEQGAALKTNGEDLGGAVGREERTNLPGSLAQESILAERCSHYTRTNYGGDQPEKNNLVN